MANEYFVKLYNETRANHKELHNMQIVDLKVWFVGSNGLGEVADVESCLDFAAITERGSVVITGNYGPFLKVNDQYWVRTDIAVPKGLWHDLDIVKQLVDEYGLNNDIATIIDTGAE